MVPKGYIECASGSPKHENLYTPTFGTCLSLSNISHSYTKLTLIANIYTPNSSPFTNCHFFIHYFLECVLTVGISKLVLNITRLYHPLFPFPSSMFYSYPLPSEQQLSHPTAFSYSFVSLCGVHNSLSKNVPSQNNSVTVTVHSTGSIT